MPCTAIALPAPFPSANLCSGHESIQLLQQLGLNALGRRRRHRKVCSVQPCMHACPCPHLSRLAATLGSQPIPSSRFLTASACTTVWRPGVMLLHKAPQAGTHAARILRTKGADAKPLHTHAGTHTHTHARAHTYTHRLFDAAQVQVKTSLK